MMKACVMGWPIAHSLSPALHSYWLRYYAIDAEYTREPVRPEELAKALARLKSDDWRGCNLTIPLKETAIVLMDRLDDTARRIGAVNTVVVENGKLAGFNTDGFGFVENLRAAAPDFNPKGARATVLGAGGAARAVVDALARAGAREILIFNRSLQRAKALGEAVAPDVARIHPWEDRNRGLEDADLVVNTTSLGMTGHPPLDLDLVRLPKSAVVNDIVYAPLETTLLQAAKARGNRVVDGLGMLLHQGRPGFELWFGVMPEVTPALRQAVLVAMR